MYKVMWLLRRKDGITFEQFRDHYENSHAVLGQKYLGHLLQRYTRTYNDRPAPAGADGDLLSRVFAAKAWDYDCITEWQMADEATFREAIAIISDPEIAPIFYADEEHFLDRSSVRLVRCDARDTAPGPAAATPVRTGGREGAAVKLWNV